MADDDRGFNAASFYGYLKEARLKGGGRGGGGGVRCRACGKLSAVPRPRCPSCHSGDVEWHQFSGKGRLSIFTCVSIVLAYMSQKGYGRSNPYCTGVVTLEEGPRVSARIRAMDAGNPQSIRTGMELVLDPEDLDQERPALAFRLT